MRRIAQAARGKAGSVGDDYRPRRRSVDRASLRGRRDRLHHQADQLAYPRSPRALYVASKHCDQPDRAESPAAVERATHRRHGGLGMGRAPRPHCSVGTGLAHSRPRRDARMAHQRRIPCFRSPGRQGPRARSMPARAGDRRRLRDRAPHRPGRRRDAARAPAGGGTGAR